MLESKTQSKYKGDILPASWLALAGAASLQPVKAVAVLGPLGTSELISRVAVDLNQIT